MSNLSTKKRQLKAKASDVNSSHIRNKARAMRKLARRLRNKSHVR